MNAKDLAEILNGSEITDNIEQQAKDAGLVVVFGYSDDNMEFRGALDDEFGCYGGGQISFTKEGLTIEEDDMDVLEKYNAVPPLNVINAIWDELYDTGEGDEPCCWQYITDIPHETFRVMEGTEGKDLFCVGIVFSISDLK